MNLIPRAVNVFKSGLNFTQAITKTKILKTANAAKKTLQRLSRSRTPVAHKTETWRKKLIKSGRGSLATNNPPCVKAVNTSQTSTGTAAKICPAIHFR